MRPVMAALSFNWIVSAKAKERPDQATNMTNANRFNMGRSYLRRAMVTSRLWAGQCADLFRCVRAAAAAHGGAAAPPPPNKNTTLGRSAVDLSAPHAAPLLLSNLPIFRGIDIKQFVRLAARETHGLGAERAGQLVQRELPDSQLPPHDWQSCAAQ